jgi:hypothetical protein
MENNETEGVYKTISLLEENKTVSMLTQLPSLPLEVCVCVEERGCTCV